MDNDINLRINSGDLASTVTGKLDVISGIDAIWQSFSLRLSTQQGSYIFDPSYGGNLGQYVDEPLTDSLQEQINSEIIDISLQDDRIQSVTVTSITQQNGLNIELTIVASDGSSTSGIVVIGG